MGVKDEETSRGGEDEDGLEEPIVTTQLDEAQKESLNRLKELHLQHLEAEREYEVQLRALKQRYQRLNAPLYQKRSEVLAACSEDVPNSIPNFWLTAMKNHVMLADMLEPVDEPVLHYLQDIRWEWLGDTEEEMGKVGFQLTFHFHPKNPYFEPNELSKAYHMEVQDSEKESTLVSTDSTEILWRPGKDITKKTVTRKQKNKRTKQIRKLTETVSVPSFFNFFSKKEIPTDEDLENMTEDDVEELEVLMEADYDAGVVLRDKVIPRALLYYTGEAVDSDMEVDDEDVGEEEEEDEDEDEEEEDEEDAEPSPDGGAGTVQKPKGGFGAKGKRGPRKKDAGEKVAEEQPNCKQQ